MLLYTACENSCMYENQGELYFYI